MPDDRDLIPDHSGLLRRIHPKFVTPDYNTGRKRLSSGAFRDSNMSVDVESMLTTDGRDWTFSLRNWPSHFLVRLQAGFTRAQQQSIEHKPQADNPYHAEVVGRKSGAICDAFRREARWVKKPQDAD
jgi:hypothetical protein